MCPCRLGRTGKPTGQEIQLGRPAARVNGCCPLCQDECAPISYGSFHSYQSCSSTNQSRCPIHTITFSANPSTHSTTTSSPAVVLEAKQPSSEQKEAS